MRSPKIVPGIILTEMARDTTIDLRLPQDAWPEQVGRNLARGNCQ
jgi:hypothetical protein